ncbi:rhomboid domain-containing protein 1 [Paragonimus westermani]|uniref:Rhomboid domain-containing protein 1 n=1 Tax=Paragonimus westermani TaxID=34504 RepID=A0A5J4NDJ5_9TREM|nr:rhomboid domain-containing protein 1 [Paragonimus westermani]
MERMIGYKSFIRVLTDLMFRSQLFHLILNNVLYIWTSNESYANDCYIGISGLVFAINVLSNFSIKGHWDVATPLGTRLHLSKSFIAWLDLFFIQFPIPTSSLVGHCAGVLAGLSYKTEYFEKHGPINFNELERLEDIDEQSSSN